MFRLLKRYRTEGAPAIRYQARGKAPNNKTHKAKRDYAVVLVKDNYEDFGPTLAAEMLAEHHSFKVSRERLRKRPLTHPTDVLQCNRCNKTASGYRANNGAHFTSHDYAVSALVS